MTGSRLRPSWRALDSERRAFSPAESRHETWRAPLWGVYVSAGYADELADRAGFDDWYKMLEDGVMAGRVEDVDAAVTEAARALAEG